MRGRTVLVIEVRSDCAHPPSQETYSISYINGLGTKKLGEGELKIDPPIHESGQKVLYLYISVENSRISYQ